MIPSDDMEPRRKPFLTPEEYLALERQAETKSEYLNGEIFAMSGGSFPHNLISGNLVGELRQVLKRSPCRVCPGDQRIHIPATGLYTYPDAVVVCGEPRFEDEELDTLLNPTLIVEVLSPSTEAYDRGKKFEHYRSIDSLAEYLLVSQSEPRVEQFLRQEDGIWLFKAFAGRDARMPLPSLGCEIALAEIYDKVEI